MMRKFLYGLPVFVASPAFAHVGADGATHHLAAGLAHPFSGLDHCLAMVAVGLVAAFMGGGARALLPMAFLAAMLGGFVLGVTRIIDITAHEAMILASLIGLGLALVVARPLPLAAGAAVTAFFGLAHGFAHGVEGSLTVGYAIGFLAATAMLHGIGLAIGYGLATLGRPVLFRLAGSGIALAGLALATL